MVLSTSRKSLRTVRECLNNTTRPDVGSSTILRHGYFLDSDHQGRNGEDHNQQYLPDKKDVYMSAITKNLNLLVISAALTIWSFNVQAGIPTIDVEGALETEKDIDFCIYNGHSYSIGSVIDMGVATKECKRSIDIPSKKASWVNYKNND